MVIYSIQRFNNFNLKGFIKDFGMFVFNRYKQREKGTLGMESGLLL